MTVPASVLPTQPSDTLLQLELVQLAFSDPAITWQQRPVDARWYYSEILPQSMTGFNPGSGSIFYGQCSATNDWIESGFGDARAFNEKDRLVKEVLFGVHDYLHNFAYRAIQQLQPKLRFGCGPVTQLNFEDHVFLHLLTEAVATVGLDYWFLCTLDLNERLQIGTNIRALTVSYHCSDSAEHRRFNADFETQNPSFLRKLCEFYCSGEFIGFSVADIRQSPQLLRWLAHEITYGEQQRIYAREWFAHLSHEGIPLRASRLAAPITCDAGWQIDLMEELGADLWDLVHGLRKPHWATRTEPHWVGPVRQRPDFRFRSIANVNLEELAWEIEAGWHTKQSATFAIDQYFASFDYSSVDPRLLSLVPVMRERPNLKQAMLLMCEARRLDVDAIVTEDVFLLP